MTKQQEKMLAVEDGNVKSVMRLCEKCGEKAEQALKK